MRFLSIRRGVGALSLAFLAALPLASSAHHGDIYSYQVHGVPWPKGQSVAVILGHRFRDGEAVDSAARSARIIALNAAGEWGDEPRRVTIPVYGFVRLNNADLALGHETGARRIWISADGPLDVTAMRIIWGDHAVALPVHEEVIDFGRYAAFAAEYARLPSGKLALNWGVALNQRTSLRAEERARAACPEPEDCKIFASSAESVGEFRLG